MTIALYEILRCTHNDKSMMQVMFTHYLTVIRLNVVALLSGGKFTKKYNITLSNADISQNICSFTKNNDTDENNNTAI